MVFILGTFITHFVTRVLIKTGLTGLDRVLGLGFGVLRGGVIIIILVILGHHFPQVPDQDWWKQSMMVEHFENIVIWIEHYIPDMDASDKKGIV